MVKSISFLVVDDHPVFRQGLVALVQSDERYKVCAEAGSEAEALATLEQSVPDVVLSVTFCDPGSSLLVTHLCHPFLGTPSVPICQGSL